MPEILTPGIDFLEREVGPNPIQFSGTSAAAFIGLAEKGPVGEPVFVSSASEFDEKFGNDDSLGYLTQGVQSYFEAGGNRAYIVRTAHYDTPEDSSSYTADAAKLTIDDGADTPSDVLDVTAETPGTWFNDYHIAVSNVDDTSGEFDLEVVTPYGDSAEIYHDLTTDSADENSFVETVINDGVRTPTRRSDKPSGYINVSVTSEGTDPAAASYAVGDGSNGQQGTNGDSSIADSDYTGDSSAHSGLYALNSVPEMLNIVIPGNTSTTVHNTAINYVKNNTDRGGPYGWDFYLSDLPVGLDPQGAMSQVRDTINTNSWEGIYYPWVEKGSDELPVAPYMAGIMAQADQEYGPWRAPAGTRYKLPVDSPVHDVTKSEQQILNPYGVNAIRHKDFEGIVPWGARTGNAGSKWQYISTRRLFNFVKHTLHRQMQWTIFEMNGPRLWERVEDTLDSFMAEMWRMGAFGGQAKEDSYFVQCDEEINPPEARERGILRSRVGINPVEPVEFHIITLENHTSGQTMPNS